MKISKPPLKMKWLGFIAILLMLVLTPTARPEYSFKALNINKNKSLNTDVIVKEYEKNKTKMGITESTILVMEYANLYDIDWRLVEAIILHETGNRTSSAFRNKHNSCGMMGNNGLIRFSSESSGVESCVKNLKNNYFNSGLNTIEKIQPRYAPVSKTWVSKIHHYYDNL